MQIGQSTSLSIDGDPTRTCTPPFHLFSFSLVSLFPSHLLLEPPPSDSFVRVMAIHKAPEMISENLTCCPKHVDEQKRAGEK